MKIKDYNNKKWIIELTSVIFLGFMGIIMLASIIWMVAQLKNPPPDINKLKVIFTEIMPFYLILGSGVVGGLTWTSLKKHKTNKELAI